MSTLPPSDPAGWVERSETQSAAQRRMDYGRFRRAQPALRTAMCRSTRLPGGLLRRRKCLVPADEIALRNANGLVLVCNRVADALRLPAVLPEDGQGQVDGGGGDDIAEADAHIEDFVHLA